MRIALFGGTFDPIHHGHLILARDAREQLGLDRVIFIPAARSPFKSGTESTPPEVRLAMVQAALAEEPGLFVDDLEIVRGGTSYTIETVLAARQRWPGAELFWFIGHDHVPLLETWHRAEELRALVQFVVFSRNGDSGGENGLPRVVRQLELSATEVRTRVAHGQSIRYLVPEPVRQLIEQHRLYRSPI